MRTIAGCCGPDLLIRSPFTGHALSCFASRAMRAAQLATASPSVTVNPESAAAASDRSHLRLVAEPCEGVYMMILAASVAAGSLCPSRLCSPLAVESPFIAGFFLSIFQDGVRLFPCCRFQPSGPWS